MKITAIKQQVKTVGRYSIFVDEKYGFSLSELGLINSGLKLNQEITEQQLVELKDTAKADKAYNQSLNLLSRRPRSRWELEDYLKRKGYDPALSEDTLNKLSELGYVDDSAFAKAWVANRRLLKTTSRRRLQLELRQKHVPVEIIDKALTEDEGETDEKEILKALVEKKRDRYPDRIKFTRYLLGQGFNYGDIKEALSEKD